MDIKIKPIEIDIDDLKSYCDIAFLVDKDDFLQDVIKARKEWGIIKTFKSLNDWYNELKLNRCGVPATKDIPLPHGEVGLKEIEKRKGLIHMYQDNLQKFIRLTGKFDLLSQSLRKKYMRTPNFDLVIKQAISCGRVEAYQNTYATFEYPEPITSIKNPFNEPRIAIIVTPNTRKEDVIKVFDEQVAQYQDEYFVNHPTAKVLMSDTISNIKRDRKWFWEKKQGKTYLQVAMEDTSRIGIDAEDYAETVRKAIKQYEKRLI